MDYWSIGALLVVPILFAFRVMAFAPERRQLMLVVLWLPAALGLAMIMRMDEPWRAIGTWLFAPSLQLLVLYGVAAIFKRAAGRELNNIIVGYIRREHAVDSMVCGTILVLITLVPTWLLHEIGRGT